MPDPIGTRAVVILHRGRLVNHRYAAGFDERTPQLGWSMSKTVLGLLVHAKLQEQGLPVTILNAPDDTQALVLEMGMRGFGEIGRLCTVGRPTIGIVTRVAAAHTERVGGIDGVARHQAVRRELAARDHDQAGHGRDHGVLARDPAGRLGLAG